MEYAKKLIELESAFSQADKTNVVAFFLSNDLEKYLNDTPQGIKINLSLLPVKTLEKLYNLVYSKMTMEKEQRDFSTVDEEPDEYMSSLIAAREI